MKVDGMQFQLVFLGKKKLFVASVTILLSMAVYTAAEAAIYRCKGNAGVVEFRQTPCEEGDGGVIDVDIRTTEWIDLNKHQTSQPASVGNRKKRKRQSNKPVSTEVDDDRQSKACWRVKSKIEQIEWKLRKGYKPAQGERLRRQRREKEAYLRRFCR